jgi:hypothetical protein
MKMLYCWKNFLWMGCFALSSFAAQGQDIHLRALPDATCQELDANDLVAADPKVVNFNPETHAYVVCMSQQSLPAISVVTAGLVPRFGTDAELGLDDFQQLKTEQSIKSLFVNSAFGEHRVIDFPEELLPLSTASADELLGPVKSHTVNKPFCKTEYQTKQVCKIQPQEVCKTVYGRTECYIKQVKVCKDVTSPVEVCVDQPTLEYYRELSSLTGHWKQKPAPYCAKGQVEKRTRVVYGKTIQEQRCCETMIVYGQVQKACGPWEAL